jgi:hypothetical protein
MKLTVGTRVRIKRNLEGGEIYDDVFFAPEMEQFRGQETTITEVDETYGPYYELADIGGWVFSDAMLDVIEMTKEDLKAGMLVKTRDGRFAVLTPVREYQELNLCQRNYGLCNLSEYEGFTHLGDSIYDIVAVYGYSKILDAMAVNPNGRELLWKAKRLEVTMEDVYDKFGEEVTIVDDLD